MFIHEFYGIRMKTISQEMLMVSIIEKKIKIMFLKLLRISKAAMGKWQKLN